jgi:hypothetical protein
VAVRSHPPVSRAISARGLDRTNWAPELRIRRRKRSNTRLLGRMRSRPTPARATGRSSRRFLGRLLLAIDEDDDEISGWTTRSCVHGERATEFFRVVASAPT